MLPVIEMPWTLFLIGMLLCKQTSIRVEFQIHLFKTLVSQGMIHLNRNITQIHLIWNRCIHATIQIWWIMHKQFHVIIEVFRELRREALWQNTLSFMITTRCRFLEETWQWEQPKEWHCIIFAFIAMFYNASRWSQINPVIQLISSFAMPSIQHTCLKFTAFSGCGRVYLRIILYDATTLLPSQKMALDNIPANAILSLTVHFCMGLNQ